MKRASLSWWRRIRHIRNRQELLSAIEADIRECNYPRLQMLLILLITAGLVFLSSSLLWHLGIGSLWIRYLCAMLLGYIAFMGLLYIWLRFDRDDIDLNTVQMDFQTAHSDSAYVSAGGGDPAGGGASGSWESHDSSVSLDSDHIEPLKETVSETSDANGFDLDVDEGVIPLILIAAVVVVLFSSLYVVYIAPSLFAELTADVLLALYSHRFLKNIGRRHWLESAFKKTIIPFTLSLMFVVGLAIFIHRLDPETQTLSQFLSR